VIAAGTAEELKNRIGGDVVEFEVVERSRLGEAVEAVSPLSDAEPGVDSEGARVSVRVGDRGSYSIVETVRRLDALGIGTEGLSIRRPSLDDVFLALTGRGAEEPESRVSGGSHRTGRQR
jgi:ABC-2 type transport system ATP-binding protein